MTPVDALGKEVKMLVDLGVLRGCLGPQPGNVLNSSEEPLCFAFCSHVWLEPAGGAALLTE